MQPRKRGANPDRLTPSQRLFCEYLLADLQFNGTAAARRAGYAVPGVAAAKLMRSKAVLATIGKAISERRDRARLEQDDVLELLAEGLFLDPLKLFEVGKDGELTPRDLEEVPVNIRRWIKKWKVTRKTDKTGKKIVTFDIELPDKATLITLAMKHLGIAGADNANLVVDVSGDVLLNLLKQVEQDRRTVDADFIRRIGSDGE